VPQYSPPDTRPRPRGAGSPYPSGDGWPYTSDNDYDWLAADVARFVGGPYSNGGGGAYPGNGGGSYPGNGGWAYPGSGGGSYPGSSGAAYPGTSGGSYPGSGGWAYPSDGGSRPTIGTPAYSPPASGPYPVGVGRQRPRHRKPPSQRMRRSGALLALTLAGGIAAIGFVDAGGGHPAITGADELNGKSVALMPPRAASVALAASALPEPVGQPVQAYMPRHSAENRKSGTPKKRATAAPGHSASPSPTSSAPAASGSPTHSAAPSPTSSPTQPATGGGGGGSCTNPSFTTSGTFGSENLGAYTVANNMWNVGGGGIAQTLSACSSSSWFVKATVADDGGGVKTYPNSHLNFDNTPKISSLNSVTSTFAQNTPDSGNYEDAYDIWLNGTAGAGGDEIMIWTENHGQIPAGSPTTSVTFDGQSYTVWKGTNGPVSFVANSNVTSGNLNLLQFFQWLMNKGWERTDSTLNQVDYGAELVSTNGPETFNFSDFSVSSS
jgi:Glycosyl hydrolase family 12